jgi:HK97 family phage major capsid protein
LGKAPRIAVPGDASQKGNNVMRKALLASAAAAAIAKFPSGAIFADAGSSEQVLADLREKLQGFQASTDALIAKADAENDGNLSDEDLATIEENAAEAEKLAKQIKAREAATKVSAGTGRRTAPEPREPNARTAALSAARSTENPRGGFKSFGEFALTVKNAANAAQKMDDRLMAAATTYGNEGTGADGGFAVPPTFRTEIWQKVMGQENLLARCAQLTTGGNSITIPKDETTPWQTTGGVQAYWEAEAAAATASKPSLEMATIRLAKLMALVPVSDELLEDAPGMQSWLTAKAPEKMAAKVNTAIIRGTGVGQPLGILNAPCLVSVAKETSQPASTVYFANINKMWARMYAPCRRNAVWLINQDIEPQLDAMAFDPAATSKVPVYLPQNGVSDSPYATLKGRPVIPIEACSTLSTQGDIILADLTQYWAITKGQDVRQDVSMHLYFDQGLQAFRFTFRVNGQPIWGSTASPENGSNTRSCFVTLDAR